MIRLKAVHEASYDGNRLAAIPVFFIVETSTYFVCVTLFESCFFFRASTKPLGFYGFRAKSDQASDQASD